MALKCVLITGTSSGIGRELLNLLTPSYYVICINRKPTKLCDERDNCHEEILDITDGQAVREMLARQTLKPNYLILNAGINKFDNSQEFNRKVFDEVFETNFFGALSFVTATSELGYTSTKFIAMSSTSNIIPNPAAIGYFLSKKNISDMFTLLNYNDRKNEYKVAVISPVKTNISRNNPELIGIQKKIFDTLAINSNHAAKQIIDLMLGDKRTAKISVVGYYFYVAVRMLLAFLPGLYKGGRRK